VPQIFEEGYLRFRFEDTWFVVKYDVNPDYNNRIGLLKDTKAVDFVGVLSNLILYFIEVKDFRGYRIQNRHRLRDGELALEVAQKVRDTIAGVVAAHHRGNSAIWGGVVGRLTKSEPPVRVLLWLEDDIPPGPRGRRHNQASVLTDALKSQLQMAYDSGACRQPEGGRATRWPDGNQPSGSWACDMR
jgi:hypothetical protein